MFHFPMGRGHKVQENKSILKGKPNDNEVQFNATSKW